jgi:hypothetical protein
MLKTFLASTALSLVLVLPAGAAVQPDSTTLLSKATLPATQMASNSGSGSANSGPGGGDDDGPDHEDEDHDGDESGSGRSKPRVPGGSGCDDAGDVEEHASCSP